MSATIGEVVAFLEELFPLEWAEPWDQVGLVVGAPNWEVSQLRLAVDPTVAEAQAAAAHEGTLLITHHPLLLKGVHFLPATTGKGAVVTTLARSGGGLWCGHTNADRSRHGTVGAWKQALGLENAHSLQSEKDFSVDTARTGFFGLGVVGELPEPITVAALARAVSQKVPATAQGVLYTGEAERTVRTVAVCPGAGDSFLDAATAAGVDAYITSDLRHHPALEHLEGKADASAVPALLDVPHYASEFLYLPHLAQKLRERFSSLTVEVSDRSSDPFTGVAR